MTFVTAIDSEAADLSTAEIVDLSTYTSPARDELALYLYLYKRDSSLSDTAVSVSNTDPLNVTAWSFTVIGDGWYRAILFGFPIWAPGTYAANKCVYYSGNYYKANTSTAQTPGGANWDLITDILSEVLNLYNSGVEITQTNNFTTMNAEASPLGDQLQDLGPKIRTGKCKNINDAVTVLLGESLIDSAWFNFERGDNVEAQQIIDYVNSQWAA
jgi:hypothetical protein